MAENDLIVICKNCNQEIHYLREPEKGMGYIECPKCKCSIDQEGTVFVKPAVEISVQKEIDDLLVAHKQLHAAFALEDLDNYYEFQKYYDRHEIIVKDLESRNTYHISCEDFIDDYSKFEKQQLKSDAVDINKIVEGIKSFKLKDPFLYLSKSGSIMINSTKEDFNNSALLKFSIYKILRMLPRNYWGAFKFISSQDDIALDKPLCELGCLRIDAPMHEEQMLKTIDSAVLKDAQISFKQDKIILNKFFMLNLKDQYFEKGAKFTSSDFIENDFPVYVRKLVNDLDCQIHKDGKLVTIYSSTGENITESLQDVVKFINEVNADQVVFISSISRINEKNNDFICNIHDVLYFNKDIHNLNFSERKCILDSLGIKQSSFEPKNKGYCLNKSPYIVCKKKSELEKAIERIAQTKNYCGVVINTDTGNSLKHQQSGSFIYSTHIQKNNIFKQCGQQFSETAIICDFLNCAVKDIYINVMRISGVEAGNIFNAVDVLTKKFTLVETRNFGNGGEIPPIYQEIKLKKNLSKVFLIEGTRFYYDDIKNAPFIIQCYPVWGGYQARFISHINSQELNIELKKHISVYAQENNFLKNEKFSVSGDFLDTQTIEWDDLKLAIPIKDKLKKLESLIAKNDPSIDSRGLIFVGPPGCGKTLTGKLLSKMAPTFIWVTAKDFADMGTTYALSTAFDLARNLRPTILFIEDIDSYIEYGMIDLLKTELDGMKLNNGVFTILTSNFPENLPEAIIDRPGRFHDIIYFTLPDESIRKEMLQYFMQETMNPETISSVVKQTEGFSGAHIREICRFAQIIKKEDNLSIDVALIKSLDKLLEQRQLIHDLKSKNRN